MGDVTACNYMPHSCTWSGSAIGTTVDFNYSISAQTEITFQSETGGAIQKYKCADMIIDWTLTCRDLTNVPSFDCESSGDFLFNSTDTLVVVSYDVFGGSAITYTLASGIVNGTSVSITRTDGTATISGKALFGASGATGVART